MRYRETTEQRVNRLETWVREHEKVKAKHELIMYLMMAAIVVGYGLSIMALLV